MKGKIGKCFVVIALLGYGVLSCAAILKLNTKINNLSEVVQESRASLSETIQVVENLKEDRNRNIVRYQREDGSTLIECNTENGKKEYTFYQLPMADNDGGCCYAIKLPNGKLVMIDSGYESDAKAVQEFITAHGGVVSAWFITHPHFDHVGGLLAILKNKDQKVKIEKIYYNGFTKDYFEQEEAGKELESLNNAVLFHEFEQARTNKKIKFIPVAEKDVITINDITITCMNSFRKERFDVNANSLALHFEVKGITTLFTGDITDQSIKDMCSVWGEDNELWNVDFVQVPHHGYQAGISNNKLYKLTRPLVAFVDCSTKEYETNAVGILNHLAMLEEDAIPVVKRFEGVNKIIVK